MTASPSLLKANLVLRDPGTARVARARPSALVQRTCACGRVRSLTGECEQCRRDRFLGKPSQRKLAVGAAGDEAEREADQVAEATLRPPRSGGLAGALALPFAPPLIQRRAVPAANTAGEAPNIVHEVLASPGQPLDAASRAFFEPRLGRDLGAVRLHTGARAAESARRVDALAYTVGSHVVMGPGAPSWGSAASRRLLAHELAHVVQQNAWGHPAGAPAGVLRRAPFLPIALTLGGDVAPKPAAESAPRRAQESWQSQWEDLKKAGYGYLIRRAEALQARCIKSLRNRADALPAVLQPAAHGLVGVVAFDLAMLFQQLFFDLGLVVGVGEGVVGTLAGMGALMEGIVRVGWHYVLGTIFAVQQQLADLGLREQPDEALIRPLGDDLFAAQMAWHDLCYFPLDEFLLQWGKDFMSASPEEQQIKIGSFVGELAVFYATWEASATRLGKLRIPPLPPAAPEAVPVLVGAGRGGTMAMELEATGSAIQVGVGGPMGVGGAAVAQMAGRGREREERDTEAGRLQEWQREPVNVLRRELDDYRSKAPGFESFEDRINALAREYRANPEDEGVREQLLQLRQEMFTNFIESRISEFPREMPGSPRARAELKIPTRGETPEEKLANWEEDFKLLQDERIRRLAYDPRGNAGYRLAEFRTAERFIAEGVIGPESERSVLEFNDLSDSWTGTHYSLKGDFRNVAGDPGQIVKKLVDEIRPGRNVLADLDAAGIPHETQDSVRAAVEIVRDELRRSRELRTPVANLRDLLEQSAHLDAGYASDLAIQIHQQANTVDPIVHYLTYRGLDP